jgi:septal ring-binding cell division protein DamX
MRRKNITSHIKLPIIVICLIYSSLILAKNKDNETNIVCFAAQNKWICAPEDQQNIANEKATKLLDMKSSEVGSSEVVIKPINIPKFNANNTFDSAEYVSPQTQSLPSENTNQENNAPSLKPNVNSEPEIELKNTPANNPYAHLWSHQLIGVSTPQNAINYVKQKNLNKDDVLILKSTRAEQDWWIVLLGLYKDKQTGIDNTKNLPDNIDTPWLRPLKNLDVKGFIDSF